MLTRVLRCVDSRVVTGGHSLSAIMSMWLLKSGIVVPAIGRSASTEKVVNSIAV